MLITTLLIDPYLQNGDYMFLLMIQRKKMNFYLLSDDHRDEIIREVGGINGITMIMIKLMVAIFA